MTFSIACFLGYFWATYLVPETANVSLEEIDAVFKSSAGAEDAVLKRQVCWFTICNSFIVLWSSCKLWVAELLFYLQIEVELGLQDLVRKLGAVGLGMDGIYRSEMD